MKVKVKSGKLYLLEQDKDDPMSRQGVPISKLPVVLPGDYQNGHIFEVKRHQPGSQYVILVGGYGWLPFDLFHVSGSTCSESTFRLITSLCSSAVKQLGVGVGEWFDLEIQRVVEKADKREDFCFCLVHEDIEQMQAGWYRDIKIKRITVDERYDIHISGSGIPR